MRAFAAVILLALGTLVAIAAVADPIGDKTAGSAVPPPPEQVFGKNGPVEKLSLGRPSWERASGLLVAELTVSNGNDYPVNNVIIACDFFDASGNPAGTRGTAIRGIFKPGNSRIGGVEFIRFARDLHGGECRTLSAKPVGSANDME
jgi:hypothetical protein